MPEDALIEFLRNNFDMIQEEMQCIKKEAAEREERLRKEAAEREERLRKEADEREEKWHSRYEKVMPSNRQFIEKFQ